jgi:hypothetical protein
VAGQRAAAAAGEGLPAAQRQSPCQSFCLPQQPLTAALAGIQFALGTSFGWHVSPPCADARTRTS